MKECPICHKSVADSIKHCPECGHDFDKKPKSTGYKLIVTIVGLAICFLVCAAAPYIGIPALIFTVFKLLPNFWNDKY